MNSKYTGSNTANSNANLYGAHYIELLSDKVTYENNEGKFLLSYLTPTVDASNSYDFKTPSAGNASVINKDNLGNTSIVSSNYLTIKIPKHLFSIKNIKITTSVSKGDEGQMLSCTPTAVIEYNEFTKGQKFLVVNLSGSLEKPYIIGVIE